MIDRRQKYEDKGQRPRAFYGLRLSLEEVKKAQSLMQEGETVQDVLRRLLAKARA